MPKLPDNKDGQGYKVLNYQGERHFMCYLHTQETGWTYVIFFLILMYMDRLSGCEILHCVVFVLPLYCLIHKMSGVITRPLETLVQSMQVVETGDFKSAKQIPMDAERKDEVGLLTKEF